MLKKDLLGVSERSYQKKWKEGSCEPRDGTARDRRIKEVIERDLQRDAMRSRAEEGHRKRTKKDE